MASSIKGRNKRKNYFIEQTHLFYQKKDFSILKLLEYLEFNNVEAYYIKMNSKFLDNKLYEIVKSKSTIYENYNSVSFNDDCIKEGIRLAKRFITNEQCPASALNILDASGSYVKMRETEDFTILKLRERLVEIDKEKNSIQNNFKFKMGYSI